MPKTPAPISSEQFTIQLDAQIAELEDLLAKARTARAAVVALNGVGSREAPVVKKSLTAAPISQTDAIKAVLAAAGMAMRAGEIVKAIKAEYGMDVPRTNVTPTLNRLKAAGIVKGKNGAFSMR